MDVDGDPENGITITPEIMDEMLGWQIDFNFSIMDFENHPDVTGVFDHLNEMDLFYDGSTKINHRVSGKNYFPWVRNFIAPMLAAA
ncbi:MAG: hypothetical protein QM498_17010 [Desulfobacterium sp.]